MKQYLDLLEHVLGYGEQSTDRTGVGTLRIAGHMMKFDLQEGFPLVTTKRVHTKSVIHELLWFLSGDTNIKYLVDNGVKIWNEWAERAEENGDLGPIYGAQWRNFQGVDQIATALDTLKGKPDDRGIVVSAWNPPELGKMALRPCHCMFQLLNINGVLDLVIYQRSCDLVLGVPFNIASYALLCHMFAQQSGLKPGTLTWVGGDVHVYLSHLEQVEVQLSREPRPLPTLVLNKAASMFDYRYEDIRIRNYDPWPAIAAPIAV